MWLAALAAAHCMSTRRAAAACVPALPVARCGGGSGEMPCTHMRTCTQHRDPRTHARTFRVDDERPRRGDADAHIRYLIGVPVPEPRPERVGACREQRPDVLERTDLELVRAAQDLWGLARARARVCVCVGGVQSRPTVSARAVTGWGHTGDCMEFCSTHTHMHRNASSRYRLGSRRRHGVLRCTHTAHSHASLTHTHGTLRPTCTRIIHARTPFRGTGSAAGHPAR